MSPLYIPKPEPEHYKKDWTDCQLYGCLPSDSLGLCPDCGETPLFKEDLVNGVDRASKPEYRFRHDTDD